MDITYSYIIGMEIVHYGVSELVSRTRIGALNSQSDIERSHWSTILLELIALQNIVHRKV